MTPKYSLKCIKIEENLTEILKKFTFSLSRTLSFDGKLSSISMRARLDPLDKFLKSK